MKKITFIGAGHIAQAMIHGLIQSGFNPANICVSNPNLFKLRNFLAMTKVISTTDNKFAVKDSDVIFITVRPSVVKSVIFEIKSEVPTHAIIISVAACVDFVLLTHYFDSKKVKCMRIMPNIPVGENRGVIGWTAGKNITKKETDGVLRLLKPLGSLISCKNEIELDRLSLISGCGPGVVSYLIDVLIQEAKRFGFSRDTAESLAIETFAGTVVHLRKHKKSPQSLVTAVATSGGITESIITQLSRQYPCLLRKSMQSGYDRITKVAKKLKDNT